MIPSRDNIVFWNFPPAELTVVSARLAGLEPIVRRHWTTAVSSTVPTATVDMARAALVSMFFLFLRWNTITLE